MQSKTLSLIPSFYRVYGWENKTKLIRNLSETETPLRVCVTVMNSTNTPRAYCVKKHVYRPCSFTKSMCKMSLKAIEKLLNKVLFLLTEL